MDYRGILIRVRRIVRSINLESKKVQKDFGVSIPQILCLEYLKSSPNYQATQRAIREHLNLNSSTVTGIITRLEKHGLLARLPKSGDKRVTHITLTSAGDELLEKTPDLLQQRLASKLERLSPGKVEQISATLDQLIEMLELEESEEIPFLSAEGFYEGEEKL
ncbi:MarR family winged helix-turn-helix transcriptional regulator [Geofilum rhodophaeum]|uniref:MarR family winged helix-turn-helix transcriptional regulator n=1 Tax=Geofilum rhodophaeum TaxID=1965019 RepID=UPI000B521414|nr:MarR family transcriptional regulator [Geofilum rhodophaeum]